jgi:hypothetical protein
MAHTLNVETYELLKPENTLPDNATNVIERYSADINAAFGKTLEKLRTEYTRKLAKR